METYRENTVAIIRGDCCVRSSGILVDSFVLEEKLAQTVDKVYEDVEQTETDLEERVNNNITETSDSLEHKLMLLSSAVSLAMAKLPSTVTQNPEWSFVICDAEDKVVMGIKTDKTTVCYVTPEELWDYVVESLE